MTEFYAFASEHWFLTWCALWLAWGPIWLTMQVVGLTYKLISRVLRLLIVAIRGWPPHHLDADGDWKPLPQPKS